MGRGGPEQVHLSVLLRARVDHAGLEPALHRVGYLLTLGDGELEWQQPDCTLWRCYLRKRSSGCGGSSRAERCTTESLRISGLSSSLLALSLRAIAARSFARADASIKPNSCAMAPGRDFTMDSAARRKRGEMSLKTVLFGSVTLVMMGFHARFLFLNAMMPKIDFKKEVSYCNTKHITGKLASMWSRHCAWCYAYTHIAKNDNFCLGRLESPKIEWQIPPT